MNKTFQRWPVATQRYVVELSCVMICYVVILISSLYLVRTMQSGWLRVLVAIAPVLPIAGLFVVIYRYYSRQDELWRRIFLEALALAAAVTTLFMVTGSFLENVGMPRLSGFWAYCLLMCLCPIFGAMIARRYR
jgi:low temperature requirement protein LtrA